MRWDIVGHRWAVSLLRAHVQQGRIRHAYLFSGPAGIGKTTLALRFAQAVNCEQPPAPGEPCGRCRWCRQAERWLHPDLHLVRRSEDSSRILIEQIRELQRSLALSPYEARLRVGLLEAFHEASEEAQNALLKTLEEPPGRVVLLLTARSPEALLPTVVSRCEHLALRPVPADELEAALRASGQTAPAAQQIASLSGGLPGRAIDMAADDAWLEERSSDLEDLRRLLRGGVADRFAYVEELLDWKKTPPAVARARAARLVETWLGYVHDALRAAQPGDSGAGPADGGEEAGRLARQVGAEALVRAARSAQRTLEAIELFGNVRLALETLMLDLPREPAGG